MSDTGPKQAGGSAPSETPRLVLLCPIFRSGDEGIVMELVQYLVEPKERKHALWNHFHSAPWAPAFFTSYPEMDTKAPVTGQGVVMVTIDCRTDEHARLLRKEIRDLLRNLYV